MIELAFTQFLAAEPSLEALRGRRCTYIALDWPQGGQPALPAQTWVELGAPQQPTFDGEGYQKLRVQIESWAKDASSALKLREATRVFLMGVSLVELSDGTWLEQCEYIGPMGFRDNDAEAFRCASEWYLHVNFPAAAG